MIRRNESLDTLDPFCLQVRNSIEFTFRKEMRRAESLETPVFVTGIPPKITTCIRAEARVCGSWRDSQDAHSFGEWLFFSFFFFLLSNLLCFSSDLTMPKCVSLGNAASLLPTTYTARRHRYYYYYAFGCQRIQENLIVWAGEMK